MQQANLPLMQIQNAIITVITTNMANMIAVITGIMIMANMAVVITGIMIMTAAVIAADK